MNQFALLLACLLVFGVTGCSRENLQSPSASLNPSALRNLVSITEVNGLLKVSDDFQNYRPGWTPRFGNIYPVSSVGSGGIVFTTSVDSKSRALSTIKLPRPVLNAKISASAGCNIFGNSQAGLILRYQGAGPGDQNFYQAWFQCGANLETGAKTVWLAIRKNVGGVYSYLSPIVTRQWTDLPRHSRKTQLSFKIEGTRLEMGVSIAGLPAIAPIVVNDTNNTFPNAGSVGIWLQNDGFYPPFYGEELP